MYTKCFSTLICCGWTSGCTLTLLYLCRWGCIFGKLGCGQGQMVLWFHGWCFKQLQTASHIHIICVQSVLAPWYAVDEHMGAPLHCYIGASGGVFLEKMGCGWGWMLLWCHGWGYKQLQTASHIHIICIQSVLAPWYAVDGHLGTPLHCNTCLGGGDFFEKLGCGWEWMVLWCHGWGYKQLQTASHIMYKVF